jgi:hypothetical protein
VRSGARSIASIENRIQPHTGVVTTYLVEPDAVADDGHDEICDCSSLIASNQRRATSPLPGFVHFAAGLPGNAGIAALPAMKHDGLPVMNCLRGGSDERKRNPQAHR